MNDVRQEFPWNMKTVRSLAEHHIIITDEILREACAKGAEVGNTLREQLSKGAISI